MQRIQGHRRTSSEWLTPTASPIQYRRHRPLRAALPRMHPSYHDVRITSAAIRIPEERMMSPRLPATLAKVVGSCLLLTSVFWLAGCGSNNNAKPAAATATRGAAAPLAATGTTASATGAAQAVDIQNTAFPAMIKIKSGTTV